MGYTIITHFDAKSYQKIHSFLSVLTNEKISHIPYGRVEDKKRYILDTLPYHITVTSSKEPLPILMSKLDGFNYTPFDITITGIGIMHGRERSQILYFKIAPSSTMDLLQAKLYPLIENDKYLPRTNTLHMTLCISKDRKKIERIRNIIENDFKPFKLTVRSLGLYEIWPGKLMAEYHFEQP